MSAQTPWSGLAVAISADRMLVTSEGAALLLGLVRHAERLARRDGIGRDARNAWFSEAGLTDRERMALVPSRRPYWGEAEESPDA
jgi:hypothetical protein